MSLTYEDQNIWLRLMKSSLGRRAYSMLISLQDLVEWHDYNTCCEIERIKARASKDLMRVRVQIKYE